MNNLSHANNNALYIIGIIRQALRNHGIYYRYGLEGGLEQFAFFPTVPVSTDKISQNTLQIHLPCAAAYSSPGNSGMRAQKLAWLSERMHCLCYLASN